jgi:hypothetical protein
VKTIVLNSLGPPRNKNAMPGGGGCGRSLRDESLPAA